MISLFASQTKDASENSISAASHGQRFQMPLLESRQLAGNGLDKFFVGVVHTIAHRWACSLRSGQLEKVRPAKKLFSMNQNGRSTRAERLASPRSWATKRNLKRSAKAAISGTGTISCPVPRSTTTWLLS